MNAYARKILLSDAPGRVAIACLLLNCVCIAAISGTDSRTRTDGHAESGGSVFGSSAALISAIEARWPGAAAKNRSGSLESLTIPDQYANDENLRFLSEMPYLTNLTVFIRSSDHAITALGVTALDTITNLTVLKLQCSVALDPGILKAVSRIGRLQSFALNRATPPQEEYACLTNLAHLKSATGRIHP